MNLMGIDWFVLLTPVAAYLGRAALVVALGWATYLLAHRLVPRMALVIVRGPRRSAPADIQGRAHTVAAVALNTLRVVIIVVAGFTLLAQAGITITPLLAGVSLAGVAVGMAAQGVMRDIINGSLILAEDQFRVGDVVQVANLRGTVEEVNLRRTVLRDQDGAVHSIPNSQITTTSNFTRDYARVNLDLRVAYAADLDQTAAVIEQVGRELAGAVEFAGAFLEPPAFRRVEALEDQAVVLRVAALVRPGRQIDAAGELRRRLLLGLRAAGIPLPGAPSAPPVLPDAGGPAADTLAPASPMTPASGPTPPAGAPPSGSAPPPP